MGERVINAAMLFPGHGGTEHGGTEANLKLKPTPTGTVTVTATGDMRYRYSDSDSDSTHEAPGSGPTPPHQRSLGPRAPLDNNDSPLTAHPSPPFIQKMG